MEIVGADGAPQALDLVRPQLETAGAEGELAWGLLNRLAEDPAVWGERVTILVGIEAEAPVALVVRTGSHPALVVGFVHEDEVDFPVFVREMQRRGNVPTAVNGAVRCSVPFAAAWQEETGCSVRTKRELRAFELHRLRPPSEQNGAARVAVASDTELLIPWVEGFARDIDEPLEPGYAEKTVHRFLSNSDMLLWEANTVPVSMAGINRRTPSSSCVSWVYTPPEFRRHGYASSVVAALSQRELAAGASWCSLFTDLANPTSNHIYAELGYEPRCDFRHIELVPG